MLGLKHKRFVAEFHYVATLKAIRAKDRETQGANGAGGFPIGPLRDPSFTEGWPSVKSPVADYGPVTKRPARTRPRSVLKLDCRLTALNCTPNATLALLSKAGGRPDQCRVKGSTGR
jgi:hypothetical protein